MVGPLIRPEHLASVRAKVAAAIDGGATILAEAPPSAQPAGWFMSPVLVGSIDPEAPLAQQEVFGPVGTVLPYRDVDEAVRLANATDYGLSADVYCSYPQDAVRLAPRLRSGAVVINGGGTRPGVPMGGFKASGFGREGGRWGVHEFLETQYVHWPV